MRAADTSKAAEAVRRSVLRSRSGAQRVADAAEMSEAMRSVTREGIRSRHPEYSERELDLALFRLLLGGAMADLVWPESSGLQG